MRNLIGCLTGMLFLLAVVSCVDNKHARNFNNAVDESTSVFIKDGLENGQAEIKASKVAQTTSKNARVINFAQMVITDHAEINDDLQKFAIANKIGASDSVSAAHEAAIADLSNNTGAKFDKTYLQMMIDSHHDAIKCFTKAKADHNEDVQKFANKNLPVLMMHLDSANAIAASLK